MGETFLQPPAGGPHSPAATAGLAGPENTLGRKAELSSPETWHRYDQPPKNSLTSRSLILLFSSALRPDVLSSEAAFEQQYLQKHENAGSTSVIVFTTSAEAVSFAGRVLRGT